MNEIPQLYRVSEKKTLDEDELEYAINLLVEAQKIKDNSELMNNLVSAAQKKAKVYRNIKSLRDAFDEMNLNPGKARGEDDATNEKASAKKKN